LGSYQPNAASGSSTDSKARKAAGQILGKEEYKRRRVEEDENLPYLLDGLLAQQAGLCREAINKGDVEKLREILYEFSELCGEQLLGYIETDCSAEIAQLIFQNLGDDYAKCNKHSLVLGGHCREYTNKLSFLLRNYLKMFETKLLDLSQCNLSKADPFSLVKCIKDSSVQSIVLSETKLTVRDIEVFAIKMGEKKLKFYWNNRALAPINSKILRDDFSKFRGAINCNNLDAIQSHLKGNKDALSEVIRASTIVRSSDEIRLFLIKAVSTNNFCFPDDAISEAKLLEIEVDPSEEHIISFSEDNDSALELLLLCIGKLNVTHLRLRSKNSKLLNACINAVATSKVRYLDLSSSFLNFRDFIAIRLSLDRCDLEYLNLSDNPGLTEAVMSEIFSDLKVNCLVMNGLAIDEDGYNYTDTRRVYTGSFSDVEENKKREDLFQHRRKLIELEQLIVTGNLPELKEKAGSLKFWITDESLAAEPNYPDGMASFLIEHADQEQLLEKELIHLAIRQGICESIFSRLTADSVLTIDSPEIDGKDEEFFKALGQYLKSNTVTALVVKNMSFKRAGFLEGSNVTTLQVGGENSQDWLFRVDLRKTKLEIVKIYPLNPSFRNWDRADVLAKKFPTTIKQVSMGTWQGAVIVSEVLNRSPTGYQ
ncbi:MAG: hypothetical protein KDK44_03385, partial [Chlamydiia bacterium]|nr:hypothetical protein [Chlamydiia bacterium]